MIKELHKKLFALKKEVGKISKDSENPFYKSKYFDINKLLEHIEPLLSKHNLLLLQPTTNDSVSSSIIDIESGEVISSSLSLPQINDPQKLGSAITYYRRYTLQSLLALQAEDDDANKTSSLQSDIDLLNTCQSKEEIKKVWSSIKNKKHLEVQKIINKWNS